MEDIPKSCEGEMCTLCGEQAYHKVSEEPLFYMQGWATHPMTAYVCKEHFQQIFMPYKNKT